MLRRIYDPEARPLLETTDSHTVAVLFLVIAIGALLDLDKPCMSPEAMKYYHLARAALSLDSVLEVQSSTTIQAIVGNAESFEDVYLT